MSDLTKLSYEGWKGSAGTLFVITINFLADGKKIKRL